MERRTAIQLIATAGAVIPLADLEQSLTTMDRILDTRIDLDDWERTVREYGYQFVRRPVGALAADLTAEITAVSHLLNQGNAPRVQAGLLRVAAELSSLLATDLHDSGRPRVARHVWRAARRSADASGDQELSVYVRAKEADDLWWAGSSPHAVRELAEQAVIRAGDTPSYGILRAHIVRCRLAADGHGGDIGEARAALRAFSETFERLPPGGHGRPEDALGEAWLHWHEAHLLTMIGDDQAQDVFDQALARYSADTPGTVSLLQLIRALDLVRRREIDDGLTHAVTTLSTGPLSTARRFITTEITKALPRQAHTHPHATELRRLISFHGL
ncbi:XRE family transcriptional regulator [Spongiactinospora sp. 9N601]|uniref:XRE family transcriptional regulator n=1 Tax=Spongiactinospora sp. 9N601 TaxID=3375149 RepID=UPI0037BA6FAE